MFPGSGSVSHAQEAQTRQGSLCYGAPCTQEHEKSLLSSTMYMCLSHVRAAAGAFSLYGAQCVARPKVIPGDRM